MVLLEIKANFVYQQPNTLLEFYFRMIRPSFGMVFFQFLSFRSLLYGFAFCLLSAAYISGFTAPADLPAVWRLLYRCLYTEESLYLSQYIYSIISVLGLYSCLCRPSLFLILWFLYSCITVFLDFQILLVHSVLRSFLLLLNDL